MGYRPPATGTLEAGRSGWGWGSYFCKYMSLQQSLAMCAVRQRHRQWEGAAGAGGLLFEIWRAAGATILSGALQAAGSGDGGSDTGSGKERLVLGELRDVDAGSDRSSVAGDGNVFHSSSRLPAGGASRDVGGGGYAGAYAGGRSEDRGGAAAACQNGHRPGSAGNSSASQHRAHPATAAAVERAAADAARQLATAEARVQELQQDAQQLERLAAERDQARIFHLFPSLNTFMHFHPRQAVACQPFMWPQAEECAASSGS